MDTIISFNADQAKQYGIHEAIILYKMIGFTRYHASNGTNYYDGNFWVYNSVRGWQEILSFMTENQVRRTLESLVNQGVILKGNYNKKTTDRMLWYAVNPEVIAIWQNCQMQMAKLPNANGISAECIISTKETTKETDTSAKTYLQKQNQVAEVVDKWNKTVTINPQVRDITPKREREVIRRIEEYGFDKVMEIVDKAEASDMLSGRKRGKWCGFDWVMQREHFVSIMEGTYDGGAPVKESAYKIVKGDGTGAKYEAGESPLEWVERAAEETGGL